MNFLKKIFSRKENEKNTPGFSFRVKSDDVFLVSYPKSGNTWVRFLLGNYLSEQSVDFNTSNYIIPDMHYNPEQIKLVNTTPRFIKSHLPYHDKLKNVIYIVRDGRDVAVSYYYFQILANEIDEKMSFEKYFYENFLNGESYFGNWGQHIASWKTLNNNTRILLVKYEDLFSNASEEMNRMLAFSNIPIDSLKINKAIEKSSYDRMKKTESQNHKLFYEERKIKETGYGFMRNGKAGDWKNYFNDQMLHDFYLKYENIMNELGYKK